MTFAKSILATVPSYIMQTMKLPNVVYSKINKIYRLFIWGSLDFKREIHLINWNKICNPKEEGDLGSRKAKELNLA